MLTKDELISYFLLEAEENLNSLIEGIEDLEYHGINSKTLEALYSASHSLKGVADFLNFERVSTIASRLEDFLERVLYHDFNILWKNVEWIRVLVNYLSILIEEISRFREEKTEIPSLLLETEEFSVDPEEQFVMQEEQRLFAKSERLLWIESSKLDELVEEIENLKSRAIEQTSEESLKSVVTETLASVKHKINTFKYPTLGQTLRVLKQFGISYANRYGKKVKIVLKGKSTRVEREKLERLFKILLHLLKNSLYHGIESQEIRKSKGKNPTGVIKIEAYSHEGTLNITVSDDGKGIDWDRITERLIKVGIVSREEAQALSERDLVNYLFSGGISESESVQRGSGRGIGLRIVKRTVQSLGGSVEVSSKRDLGTSVTVKIPNFVPFEILVKIRIGKHFFAVPCRDIDEFALASDLERRGSRVINRDREVEILSLGEVLSDVERIGQSDFVLIFSKSGIPRAIWVSEIIEFFEGLVLPLSTFVPGLEHLSGYTTSNTDEPLFVLNLREIEKRALKK